jgi:MYXO-CTERM domain-containing protein
VELLLRAQLVDLLLARSGSCDARAMRSSSIVVAVLVAFPSVAFAETYRVGPSASADFRELTELPALAPGDVVEVEGDAEYEGGVVLDSDGSAAMPIVVRGLGEGASRPRLVGGDNTIEILGDHYVLERLDVSAGTRRCVFHHAHDVTIRDTVVHDCPAQGILGADDDSGSLTLERVEVHHCGGGTRDHQIYMATDEDTHPGAVFRMVGCWLHDGNGGNNVKSRAERNEIYSNWIEGAFYHELELIGPDPAGGTDEETAREDSDVVGNVFVKRDDNEAFAVVRFGGDGTGQSLGRYRFAFNTVIVAPGSDAAVFRLFDGLESVEMHGNVFVRRGGGPVNLLREVEADWVRGRLVAGTNNWVSSGSTNVPPEWTGTITGDDPGLAEIDDLGALDPSPASMASPVVDAAIAPPPTFEASPFPSPLARPSDSPQHGPGVIARPEVGAIDVGAYEYGTAPPPMDAGTDRDAGAGVDASTGEDAEVPGPDAATSRDAGARADGGEDGGGDGGCGCRTSGTAASNLVAWLLVGLVLGRRRRR